MVLEVGDLLVFNETRPYKPDYPEDWGIVVRVSKTSATVYWFGGNEHTVERRIATRENGLTKLA